MSEFTKGKWTADDMGEYVFAHGFDMIICQMRGWGYLNANGLSPNEIIDVQIANARLIAAAPDMYGLICVLLHDDLLQDTQRYRALSRARKIIEDVTGNKINWNKSIDGDIQEGD